jgi:hypothetical protein
MTYCHVTAQTNQYLNDLGEAEALEEAFAVSEAYAEALAAYNGTEEEFWDSREYENALERYADDEAMRAAEAYAEGW